MGTTRRYRKHLRLHHYDYRQDGYYFVTLCTKTGQSLFSSDQAKALVSDKLDQIPRFFPGVSVDLAVVMPDHLHVIFVFEASRKSLGQVIQVLKSWVTREWSSGESVWQPNYYEHVIRNEAALHRIREYIQQNPFVEHVECERFYDV